MNVLSAHEFFGNEIKIQPLWVGDDEPSADSVKIVHHIKGMLMSTVLKDVVSNRGSKPASCRRQGPFKDLVKLIAGFPFLSPSATSSSNGVMSGCGI